MSTTTRPRLTEQERAQRRERDREYAQKAVEQLCSSDGWQQWLRTRATFRSYSLGNQLLIAMQHPTAEHVAGFRAWLKLGYCVRKGETSIRIWAPCPPTKKQIEAWQSNGSKLEDRPRAFFKLAAVFAQDQVADLPPPAVPAPVACPIRELNGDDVADAIPRLVALGAEIGSSVTFAPIAGSVRGSYEPATKRIVIEAEMSVNQQVATLCHELAHALVRAEPQADDPMLGYASEELIVESVAFTCIRSLGIDADPKSIPYLASWAERADLTVIEHAAGLIDRLARRIEAVLHAEDHEPAGPSHEPEQDPELLLGRGVGLALAPLPPRRHSLQGRCAPFPSRKRSVPLGHLRGGGGRACPTPRHKGAHRCPTETFLRHRASTPTSRRSRSAPARRSSARQLAPRPAARSPVSRQ